MAHKTHSLLASVGELDGVGSLDGTAIGILSLAKICASVFILNAVVEAVRLGLLCVGKR